MSHFKKLRSLFRPLRSRFHHTGINVENADSNTGQKAIDQFATPQPDITTIGDGQVSNSLPPDFRLRSAITEPAIQTLYQQYVERNISLVALDEMIPRQDEIIANTIFKFFQRTADLRHVTIPELTSHVAKFRNVFLTSPYKNNNGGANFTTALNLFLIARCLSPELIVECGVFKGASSYILKAACPNAQVIAFDPNLADLTYRTPEVTYHEHDWMGTNISLKPTAIGLCYFDDHQDQATRVTQAHQRGFRNLIMDDSWPLETPGCGWPPIPSIEMIINNWLKIGEKVRWIEDGMIWTFVQTEETYRLINQARSLIKDAHDLPSLYRETGVAPTSAGKYVELV